MSHLQVQFCNVVRLTKSMADYQRNKGWLGLILGSFVCCNAVLGIMLLYPGSLFFFSVPCLYLVWSSNKITVIDKKKWWCMAKKKKVNFVIISNKLNELHQQFAPKEKSSASTTSNVVQSGIHLFIHLFICPAITPSFQLSPVAHVP